MADGKYYNLLNRIQLFKFVYIFWKIDEIVMDDSVESEQKRDTCSATHGWSWRADCNFRELKVVA